MAGWVPQQGVTGVAGGAVDGERGGGALRVSAAVGEGDELSEGVGPLGAPEEGGMAAL